MELIKPGINIDFVGKSKLAFLISGLLILATFISLFVHGGPNYGIDFTGGILVQVRFKEPTDPASIRKALKPVGMSDAVIQDFGNKGNEFLIRAEKKGLKLEGLSDRIRQVLAKAYPKGYEVRRVEMVGPKVGKDLRRKALLAIFYALLMIAVYISGRFEQKWGLAAVLVGVTLLVQGIIGGGSITPLIIIALVVTLLACWVLRLRYALGAIVALIHDVIITVGVFSLLNKEFTLATVAALLTIIGYSLNDTIIVFDRIRENLKKGGKLPLAKVINDAVNQTLSRTILTSGTTLVVLVSLYLLGGGVIEDFAFALLVGVVVGTYSSIYVASPILLALPEGKPGLAKKIVPPPKKAAPQPAPAPQAAGQAPKVSKAKAAAAKQRKKKSKKRNKKRR